MQSISKALAASASKDSAYAFETAYGERCQGFIWLSELYEDKPGENSPKTLAELR
jgi:hypothetical protein